MNKISDSELENIQKNCFSVSVTRNSAYIIFGMARKAVFETNFGNILVEKEEDFLNEYVRNSTFYLYGDGFYIKVQQIGAPTIAKFSLFDEDDEMDY